MFEASPRGSRRIHEKLPDWEAQKCYIYPSSNTAQSPTPYWHREKLGISIIPHVPPVVLNPRRLPSPRLTTPLLLFSPQRLVDDLGYDGVGCHNKDLHTPTIDAIAAAGVKLDGFC